MIIYELKQAVWKDMKEQYGYLLKQAQIVFGCEVETADHFYEGGDTSCALGC